MKQLLIIPVVLVLTACVSEQSLLQGKAGEPVQELYAAYGKEDSKKLNDDGTYTYQFGESYLAPAYLISGNLLIPTSMSSATCIRKVITDSNGTILSAKADGMECCVMTVAGYCKSVKDKLK